MNFTDISMKSKNSILELIEAHIALFESFKHVYLFGSVINPNLIHNDIDILVIYAKYSHEIENSLQMISDELGKVCNLPIDLTALSVEEEQDTAFLKKIGSSYLKIK